MISQYQIRSSVWTKVFNVTWTSALIWLAFNCMWIRRYTQNRQSCRVMRHSHEITLNENNVRGMHCERRVHPSCYVINSDTPYCCGDPQTLSPLIWRGDHGSISTNAATICDALDARSFLLSLSSSSRNHICHPLLLWVRGNTAACIKHCHIPNTCHLFLSLAFNLCIFSPSVFSNELYIFPHLQTVVGKVTWKMLDLLCLARGGIENETLWFNKQSVRSLEVFTDH